jgi:protein-disulfide isomerase
LEPSAVRLTEDGRARLSPPFDPDRDRVDGPPYAATTLVVFGAFAAPSSRPLGELLNAVRERYLTTVRVVWRHYPDPGAHPRAVIYALAAEAAAERARLWALGRELLGLRHHDPRDLHAALVRAGLDPEVIVPAMAAGTGADRIVEDSASALASGVAYSPALFIDGERYDGELDRATVCGALDAAIRGASHRLGP